MLAVLPRPVIAVMTRPLVYPRPLYWKHVGHVVGHAVNSILLLILDIKVLPMLVPLLALAMQTQTSADLAKASEFYSECKTYIALTDKTRDVDSGSMLDAGVCLGYINGFADASGQRFGFCVKGVSASTLVRVCTSLTWTRIQSYSMNTGASQWISR